MSSISYINNFIGKLLVNAPEINFQSFNVFYKEHEKITKEDLYLIYREMNLHCPSGVYKPYPSSSTEFVLEGLLECPEFMKLKENGKVLEIGTGCGAIAIYLKKLGFDISASDIDNKAIQATKHNMVKNNCFLPLFKSDLFKSIPQNKYDSIVFNVPLFMPETSKDKHLVCLTDVGGKILDDFLLSALPYLSDNGAVYLSYSNISKASLLMEEKFKVKLIKMDFSSKSSMSRALLRLEPKK